MRGALRVYGLISSLAFGLLVITALTAGTIHLIAPATSSRIWSRAFAVLARDNSPGAKPDTAPSRHEAVASVSSSASGTVTTPPGAAASARDAARQTSSSRQSEIDVLALEARLRHLEGVVPCVARTADGGMPEVSALEKLAAWESLRAPLLELLGLLGAGCPADESGGFASATIESIAPRIAQRLRALCVEWSDSRGRIVEGLMPPTLARLLADEHTISDDRALGLLRRVSVDVAREAVERLARRSPDRAARLLEGLAGDPGMPLEDRDGQAETGSQDTSGKGRSDG